MATTNKKLTAYETMEIRTRLYSIVKDILKDNERCIEYANKTISEYDEKEANGEELDRWDRQSRLDSVYDITAREQFAEMLVNLCK